MQTPLPEKKLYLLILILVFTLFSQAQIATTHFPDHAEIHTKKEWQQFWDEYGLGRYEQSGAQFTSRAITSDKGVLTIPFSSGDTGGSAYKDMGGIIYKSLPFFPGRTAYAEYEVKFSKDFDWGVEDEKYRGGKFGLTFTVGKVGVGRNPGKGNFQVTTMWREGGKLDAYVYHAGQQKQGGKWPDKLIYTKIEPGKWYKFGLQVTLNDPGKDNGTVSIWIDDKIAFNCKSFSFSDEESVTFKPSFVTFFGGSGPGWRARNDCEILYKDITIWESNLSAKKRHLNDEICGSENGPIQAAIKLYPNPISTGTFTVESLVEEAEELLYLSVIDITGRTVYFQASPDLIQTVRLPQNIPKGMYYVQIATQQGNISKRLMIE